MTWDDQRENEFELKEFREQSCFLEVSLEYKNLDSNGWVLSEILYAEKELPSLLHWRTWWKRNRLCFIRMDLNFETAGQFSKFRLNVRPSPLTLKCQKGISNWWGFEGDSGFIFMMSTSCLSCSNPPTHFGLQEILSTKILKNSMNSSNQLICEHLKNLAEQMTIVHLLEITACPHYTFAATFGHVWMPHL